MQPYPRAGKGCLEQAFPAVFSHHFVSESASDIGEFAYSGLHHGDLCEFEPGSYKRVCGSGAPAGFVRLSALPGLCVPTANPQ
jgi:hypothetical protein